MLENRSNIEGQKSERLQSELDELNKKNADLVEKLDTVRLYFIYIQFLEVNPFYKISGKYSSATTTTTKQMVSYFCIFF